MIDKLAIISDDMDLEALKNAFGKTITAKPLFTLYNSCHKVSSTDGTHLFTAYKGPRTSNMSPFRIELNPTKLKLKYTQMMAILSQGMDTDLAKIQRIDHASDIEMPVMKAFETVRIKHKRNVRAHTDYVNGELTGFYIGSKLEQALIYNKSCNPIGSKFKPAKELKEFSHLTRFEVRHHSKKVLFKKLLDLPFLLRSDPFEKFEVLELNNFEDSFSAFQRQNRIHGMQNSFIKLNKQSHFKRDSAKHFMYSDLPERLSNIYRENLRHFFEGSINYSTGEINEST